MPNEKLKRPLQFNTVDDIVIEASRLLESGYKSNGNWDLAQTCFHLAEWTRFPMDGFPEPPFFLRIIFGAMKATGMIERMKKSLLQDGFKAGTPTAPNTVGKPNAMNDRDGVEQLSKVIERMKKFDGPIQPSPLFGVMDRDLWTKVTLLHAEHHFAFLESI